MKKTALSKMSNMRRFILQREHDESGVSGTGVVAEGVELTCGKAILTWLGPQGAVAVYDSMKNVEAVHGHEGKTKIVWLDK